MSRLSRLWVGPVQVAALLAALAFWPVGLTTASPANAERIDATTTADGSGVGQVRWTTVATTARLSPSTAGRPLFSIPAGSAVRVHGSVDGARWYFVSATGWTGWVPARSTSSTLQVREDESPHWRVALATSYGLDDGLAGSHLACGGTLTGSVPAVATDLPCGTVVVLTSGGRSVVARVLDRRPMPPGVTFEAGPAICVALRNCSGNIPIRWHVED